MHDSEFLWCLGIFKRIIWDSMGFGIFQRILWDFVVFGELRYYCIMRGLNFFSQLRRCQIQMTHHFFFEGL
jgi:hypothetical protein